MFDRVQYKKNAKLQLKGRWGIPILMTVITFAIAIILSLPANIAKVVSINLNTEYTNSLYYGGSFLSFIAWFAAAIFMIAQIHVYLLMTNIQEKITFNTFLDGMTLWIKAILATLWGSLWTFLWFCVFIIPGFIKMLSYSQMFFLIAEYPNLSVRKAMRISKVITRGYKGDLFVMGLSFIGWYILSCLTLGIGFIWLTPYYTLSITNAYKELKEVAIKTGVITIQDLQ